MVAEQQLEQKNKMRARTSSGWTDTDDVERRDGLMTLLLDVVQSCYYPSAAVWYKKCESTFSDGADQCLSLSIL